VAFGTTAAGELPLADAQWLLSAFSSICQIAFDPALFAHRCPPPIAPATFDEAADELGFRVERRTGTLDAVLAWRVPIAARVTHEGDESVSQWVLILNADETHALVLEAGASAPATVPISELRARFEGAALSLQAKVQSAPDPDALQFRTARFGLRWFIPELLKHRRIWQEVLLASLVLQLMALATPLFTQAIIDKVVVHRTASTLIALGIGMAVFLVFTAALSWVRQYLILHTGQRIDAVLGSHIFSHLFRLPPQYFQHRPTGVIAARLQGVESIREFLASTAVTLLLDLPFLLIFVAIMLFYSVKLTLLCLAILALISGLSLLTAPLFQARLNEQFQRSAANQAFLTEYVSGIETVKFLQLEPQINQRYRNLLSEYLKASLATRQLANSYNTWASSLEQLMTLSILVLGAWIVMNSTDFTIGMLVAFQMFTSRISQPLLRMVGLWQQWQQTRLSVARLGDVMNAPAESYSLTPRRASRSGPGCIEIQGLAFRYNEQTPFLFEDFNLTLQPGQLLALMGASGCGKSTLAKLLEGFYAPSQGRIRIDGIDHHLLSINELRSMFGVVPQETVLFAGTIIENLKLANPYASFEQVVAACKMAEIHLAIEALPKGYQTEIGERGVGLSGGQRQRLSIARALLKGPKVLIFDEATSSLDIATAEQIGRTINALKGRVSILFIAHALPRSLQVDQIVRIEEQRPSVVADKPEAVSQS
jgi:ATP-binding cassette, subfamily B, bacterial HlyB/CyaB